MKKYALETIGCRLNQYETERMAAQLDRLGLKRVSFRENADLYIINTCTVTGRADASSRNIISRAARKNGQALVIVAGCYVDADPEKIASLAGVDLLIKNSEKESIGEILLDKFPGFFADKTVYPNPGPVAFYHEHNRAWIKISDGCNQRCAYCIIPLVRGKLSHRPAAEITEEVNILSANGYREVVLTGVHIGRYRDETIKSIAGLLKSLLDSTDIARVRLSSIEPQEVDDRLLSVMHDGGTRICRHLHIPLQSGSDRILKLMNRPYSSAEYLETAKKARDMIPGLVVGADIIVGFPGETEADFQESVAVARSGLIDYLHVFSYSDRPGTAAAGMPGKIKPDMIKERNRILREISERHYAAALRREIGRRARAISEYGTDSEGDFYWGVTDNYLKVILPEGMGGSKEIMELKIIGASGTYLRAEPA